ncbi:MAG: DNA/RNA nuclease SfsA [Candidatus Caldarchaeum sp.]
MKPLTQLKVEKAFFLERVNRFSARVRSGDRVLPLHLTNTGRLHDLLRHGVEVVYLKNETSKSAGRLVGVVVPGGVAVVDTWTQASAFEEAFRQGLIPWLGDFRLKGREAVVGGSRVDYVFEDPAGGSVYLELKSAVYMNNSGGAMYPDTVSERGRKHIKLITALAEKHSAKIVFVAAHPLAEFFTPCDEADPLVRKLLIKAAHAGVDVRAVKTFMDSSGAVYWSSSDLPVVLDPS